jgi:tellurite resistance protein TehA-like permease
MEGSLMSAEVSSQPVVGRTARAVRDLHPGSFAFVMATGILSTASFLFGPSWLSMVFFAVACAGFAVLATALAARLLRFRGIVAADLRAPERAFGFFTVPAGIDVLAVRFALAGHPVVTAVLAACAAAVWLPLTYGVPASVLLGRSRDSVLGGVNGAWLLWIVATQSLALVAAVLILTWPAQASLLAPVSVGLWSVGLLLYLLVVTLIFIHWLTAPIRPETLGPPYWILMGATAITVLAGASDLLLPGDIPVVRDAFGFIEGFSFALWAFGTWWIPLLVILSLWRHVHQRWPLSYEPTLWSLVFPLGMYSVATLTFGRAAHLTFMAPLARFMFWVAVAAWVLVAAALVRMVVTAANDRLAAATVRPARRVTRRLRLLDDRQQDGGVRLGGEAVRGVGDDDEVAFAALPGLGSGGEGDPAAEHEDGGLARAGVLSERGVLGERDHGLAERLFVTADDGAGNA